jgi:hypothetical protein
MTLTGSGQLRAAARFRAALSVLLILAACSAVAPTPTVEPTASPPPSASPTQTDEPTGRPSPTPPTDLPWVAVDVPDAPEFSAMLRIVGGNQGLVAIGFDGGFGSIVWRLTDGSAWEDATPEDFARYGIAGAVAVEDRIVAVGRGDTINVEANDAAVLLSEDGSSWRPAAIDIRGQLIDVIATDAGLVALGGVPAADSAAAWRSRDGVGWERIGQDFEHAFLWSVVDGGPGLVAVGWRRNPDPQLAVWTSSDGESWELAPDLEGSIGYEATHIVAAPDGTLVMAGSAFDGSGGRIWTSSDGVAWEPAVSDMDGGYARRLTTTPWGIVAVGGRDMDGMAWISADAGRSWTQLGDAIPGAYLVDAFATDGGTLIVTGATQEGTVETGITGTAALWTMTFD